MPISERNDEDLEVIGNVHYNPELLEEADQNPVPILN